MVTKHDLQTELRDLEGQEIRLAETMDKVESRILKIKEILKEWVEDES